MSVAVNKMTRNKMERSGSQHALPVGIEIGAVTIGNRIKCPQNLKQNYYMILHFHFNLKRCISTLIGILVTLAKIWK